MTDKGEFRPNKTEASMEFTGERFVPSMSGQIKYEHLHRYAIASQLTARKDVLDLACGEGYGTHLLAQTAASVIGVDNSPDVISYASRKYIRSNVSFVLGTCDSIPLPEQSIDVVVSFETIEHHDKHEEMMREVRRVLRPNGLLIISTPDRLTYSDEPSNKNLFHVKELYYDDFRSLLKKYFSAVEIYGQRIAAASFVHTLESSALSSWAAYMGDSSHLGRGACSLRSPIYFIALCSDDIHQVQARACTSVYLDPSDDLLKQFGNEWIARLRQLEAQVQQIEDVVAQKSSEIAKTEREGKVLQESLEHYKNALARLSIDRNALQQRLDARERTLAESTQTLNQVYSSNGWKVLSLYYKLRNRLLPEGTRRRNVTKLLGITSKDNLLRPSLKHRTSQDGLASRTGVLRLPRRVWEDLRLLRDMRLIAASGLFDSDWYSEQNPDVARAGVNPLKHYLQRGALEGRDPSADFHTKGYLREHPDADRGGVNPLVHYLRSNGLPGRVAPPKVEGSSIRSQDVSAAINGPIFQESELNSAGETDWQEYKTLARQISALRQRELEKLSPEAPTMVTIEDDHVLDAAKSLRLPLKEQVEVSVVIPVFNNLKLTVECLASVMAYSSGVAYEVIVVDDGSTDPSAEVLSRVENIVYIKNERNIGFLHSCNRGAERARGEYIVFLNNDAQATKGWLEPLLITLRENLDVGAVGPKMLYPDGRLQEAGVVVDRDGTSRLIGLFDDPRLPRYNYQREVMYSSGACLLVRASAFKELGGFDTDFAPAYSEDCDLSFRFRERGLRLLYNPQSVVIHHLSATSNGVGKDFKMRAVIRNRQRISEKWQRQIDDLNKIRLIAFYLPQYHPIPENDQWWGKGFTEWANVAKARPNFLGHYQPHVPSDLGFYDLRLSHVMESQADLAKRYGIHGFCYYYYWFAGKRLLEMPLDRILGTGKPDFPFCIAWANENWTRRWDGHEDEVLLAQQHSDDDDRAVMHDMMPYVSHPKYIRINGRPLLIVYRVSLFPDIRRTVQVWRDLCRQEGIGEIYLALVESFEWAGGGQDPALVGFDASIEFPPHGMRARIPPPGRVLNPQYRGAVHDYRQVALDYLRLPVPGHVRFRSVMPSWDNTPRRQNDSLVFANASPGVYQAWLEAIIQQTHEQNFGDERIVFISAWNEWAEGNHLEPDQRNGHAFLQATRNAQDAWLLDKVGDR